MRERSGKTTVVLGHDARVSVPVFTSAAEAGHAYPVDPGAGGDLTTLAAVAAELAAGGTVEAGTTLVQGTGGWRALGIAFQVTGGGNVPHRVTALSSWLESSRQSI